MTKADKAKAKRIYKEAREKAARVAWKAKYTSKMAKTLMKLKKELAAIKKA